MVDSSVVIKELTPDKTWHWDAYDEQCPPATFFHHAGWKEVVKRTFGHRIYFLYTKAVEQLQGILSIVPVPSFLFGNALITGTGFLWWGRLGILFTDQRLGFSMGIP